MQLALIMVGMVGVAGYFVTSKWSKAPEPTNHLVNSLSAGSQHNVDGRGPRTEAWKAKYRRLAAEEAEMKAERDAERATMEVRHDDSPARRRELAAMSIID